MLFDDNEDNPENLIILENDRNIELKENKEKIKIETRTSEDDPCHKLTASENQEVYKEVNVSYEKFEFEEIVVKEEFFDL